MENETLPDKFGPSASKKASQGPVNPEGSARFLLEAVRDDRLVDQFSLLEQGEKAEIYLGLNRFLTRIRQNQSEGPFWAPNLPESKIRPYRCDGILRLQDVDTEKLSSGTKSLLEGYRANIAQYGDDAIAHLCLSKRVFGKMKRNTIGRISELDQLLAPTHPLAYDIWGEGVDRYPSPGVEIKKKLRELEEERANVQPKGG